MSKKSKSTNNSSVTKKDTKNQTNESKEKLLFLGEYFNIHAFQQYPITHNFLMREAQALKDWSDTDNALIIAQFYNARGYSKMIFYEWISRYPFFEAAHSYAISQIGIRREIGAATSKFKESTIHRTLGHYSDVWREETRLINEARAAITQHSESKVVVIERFPTIDAKGDIEIVSLSSIDPEKLAANIHRNTATNRDVKVKRDYLDGYEGDE
jgi:hypothetical protein